MKPIYQDAKDQNKAGTFIYVKMDSDEGGMAYVDEKCTVPFKTGELIDAFMKRAIVVSSDRDFVIPTLLSLDGNGLATVGCIGESGILRMFTSVAD